MNPLDKIKTGILKQDWDLVCDGYCAMTGQKLLIPSQPTNQNALAMEVPCSESTLQLFKDCLLQMIEEFDFIVNRGHNTGCEPIHQDEDEAGDIEFNEVTEQSGKVGLFGNPTVLISEEVKPEHVEANKQRHKQRSVQKVARLPPKQHKVECTDCGNTFKSPVRSGEFGQKCGKCLRSTQRKL